MEQSVDSALATEQEQEAAGMGQGQEAAGKGQGQEAAGRGLVVADRGQEAQQQGVWLQLET